MIFLYVLIQHTLVPLSVNVTSHPVSPIQAIESNVTLTCTVELSPAVDIPVTVNTVWSGPAGFNITNTAQPVLGYTNTYISTAIVRKFGRNQTGNYICTATIVSDSTVVPASSESDMEFITTGKI